MDTDENALRNKRKESLAALINDRAFAPMFPREIAALMEVPEDGNAEFQAVLDEIIGEGRAVLSKKGKIMPLGLANMTRGTLIGHARGFGFAAPEDKAEADVFIPANAMNGAMHRDFVLVRITGSGRGGGESREGEVVSVLKRGLERIIGTYEDGGKPGRGCGFVIPDDKRIAGDIFIARGNSRGALSGHKCAVKIIKSDGKRSAEGIVTEILGHKDDPGMDILSIVSQLDIPVDFPAGAAEEAAAFREVTETDAAGREDFRGQTVFTIDGEDSKDFDDTVTLKTLENGDYELGVHIADVSRYVREGSELDKEAQKRGTSVYLVDRVIPMLPRELSNGICSLNPGRDRLVLSCVMRISPNGGKILNSRITEGVINSAKRMTYAAVNSVLNDKNSPYAEEYAEFLPMLREMNRLRGILRKKREERGAIDFGFPECKIIAGENGEPLDIRLQERNDATSLIEEFMLACNECVAEEYFWAELPFVYRVHESPDPEKLAKLGETLARFGYRIKGTRPKALQGLLLRLEGKPEEPVVSRLLLRSLKQARYSPVNDGHFGLAAKRYCHFTSPIRRYPDLQIHRIIKENLRGGLSRGRAGRYDKILPEICAHSSFAERRADEAEREVLNLKKVEFMADKLGETFEGIISGVTRWGIYVELPNTVEGMVPVGDLRGDRFIFDEGGLRLIGRRTKKTYTVGDRISVVLAKADTAERRLDFALA